MRKMSPSSKAKHSKIVPNMPAADAKRSKPYPEHPGAVEQCEPSLSEPTRMQYNWASYEMTDRKGA
jgi:hypothetical protein